MSNPKHSAVRAVANFVTDSGQIAILGLESARELFSSRTFSFKNYLMLLWEQLFVLGIKSLPVVLVAGLATGAVLALQLGYGLTRFGGNLMIPMIVSLAILREFGPVLTSLLLAGRIGAGITSELASMAVTEQIDAIRALGSSPVSVLVVPRLLACLIVFPAMTLIGDYVGVVSALIISKNQFVIAPQYFVTKVLLIATIRDLFGGLLKSLIFGLFIGLVACWKGLRTSGGTRGVGGATTQVVVISSILILIGDVFLTKFFISVGWFGVSGP